MDSSVSVQKLEKYFSPIEDFVGEGKDKAAHLLLCQQMHDKIREQEKILHLKKPKSALLHLYIDGMDHDQIAQELAANEEELIDTEGKVAGSFMEQTTQLMSHLSSCPTDLQLVYDIPLNIPVLEGKKDEQKNASLSEETDFSDDSDDSEDEALEKESDQEEDDDGSKSSTDEGLVVSEEGDSDKSEDEESHDEERPSDNDGEEESENDVAQDSEDEGEEDSDDEEESQKGSAENSDADSDDSAYAELDKQLFEQYMNDDEQVDKDDDDPIEDLAGASESDNDDEPQHKNMEEEHDQGDQSPDDEEDDADGKSIKKKSVRFKLDSQVKDKNPLQKVHLPKFSRSTVDSQFFNVRESEYIADEDLIGADNFKDIDFMEDIPDDDDEEDDDLGGEKATYKDFFDDVPLTRGSSENENAEDNWGLKNDNDDKDDDHTATETAKDEDEPMDTNTADEIKSRFEAELEAENKLRKELEEKNISEKPWMLQGEALAQDRPTNSVLSEYLEFASGAKLRPVVNEELCSRVERIILDRFRTKAFDDVERKAKLVDDPFEYKKKIVLDQEKSTKSLSKIYEDEYLKKQRLDSAKKAEEELPEHKKIRLAYEELEDYLDALSNAHYTPKLKHPELKIMSNLPAMQLEENTPVVANDSDALAPQEVAAPVRGLLKSDAEKTSTDRKRQRRDKKHKQHLKFARQQQNVSDKVKKATKEGKRLDASTSAKVVQTALKSGKVKKMDMNGPSIKSSTAFFKHLGEQHDAASAKHASKKRKRDDTR